MSNENERATPNTVQVLQDPRDPAVPTAPGAERVNTPQQRTVDRAPVEEIFQDPANTGRGTAPQGGTGILNTDAGNQFGEDPGPIPATFAEKVANQDTGVRALPSSSVRTLQPAPVVVGTHQVVLETATPPLEPSAETAPAGHFGVGVLGPFGLVQLARQVYGNEDRAADIFDANKDTMVSPDTWYLGQVVRLPD